MVDNEYWDDYNNTYNYPDGKVYPSQEAIAGRTPSSSNNVLSDYIDESNWLGKLQKMAASGDEAALDRLFNYFASESSANIAREWTAGREDNQYQRLVADLKAAGINPYALLQNGATPISSSSSGSSYSGSYAVSKSTKEEANKQRWVQIFTSILTAVTVAAIAAA